MLSPGDLRRELSERNLARAAEHAQEQTFGDVPSIVYVPDDQRGTNGNFLDASFRRIQANPAWAARLHKAYSGTRRIAGRRSLAEECVRPTRRAELDCATSSDALLMNVFCYPGLLSRPAVKQLLGLDQTVGPEFGVRVGIPLRLSAAQRRRSNAPAFHPDRTEIDCRLGDLLLEAKLTESGFQVAPGRLVERYRDLEDVFELQELPRHLATGDFVSYQLIRGVLAAYAQECRFAVVCDARRVDLREAWLQVLRAVRSFVLRSRLQMVTWQEIAGVAPTRVQQFLSTKYGIHAA